MRRPAAVMFVLLVVAPRAFAAEVHASLDRDTARVGDQVILTVEARGTMQGLPEPDLDSLAQDFDVAGAGSSRNYSFVNGQMSAATSRRYVLIPKREGTFTIGPLTVDLGKETAQTEALTLTVTASPPPPTLPPSTGDQGGSTKGSEDVFVRAFVDNTSPYVYQQVTYRVRLYTRVNLLDNPSYSAPTTQGFWKEDLPAPEPTLETVNGKRYQVLEVRMAVFPTAPGALTLGEASVQLSVRDASRPGDPFSFFGGSLLDGKQITLRTDPITLQVKALPPGAPPGFHGAVGDFQMQVSADRTTVTQNQPVTLTVKLTGAGHLRTVGEIELPTLPQFRSYPSTSKQDVDRQSGTIRGTLTQQFVLVPLAAGKLTIPPIRVVTFSPKDKAYRTLTSEPLVVESAAAPAAEGVAGTRGDIEVLGHDILFIETDLPDFRPAGSVWSAARTWLAAIPFPLAAWAAAWGWVRRRRRLGADLPGLRRRRAAREARARLKKARGASAAEAPGRSGEALRFYLADRYGLPRAGLTAEGIADQVHSEGGEAQGLLEFLDRCDASRYAPGSPATGGDGWIAEAERWIATLERGAR